MKVFTVHEMFENLLKIKDKKLRCVMLVGDYKLIQFPAETSLGKKRINDNISRVVGCYIFNKENKYTLEEFKEDVLETIKHYENTIKLSSPA